MRFTLFYDGDLPPNGNAAQKNDIRAALHPQIKDLWADPGLSEIKDVIDPNVTNGGQHLTTRNGFTFASVVHRHYHLRARINIFMQRSGPAGHLIDGGDIDNRLKTLFDALAVPANQQQIPQRWNPAPHQAPLHCLLEDDRLITSVAVDTERLLGPVPNQQRVRLTIRVHLHAAKNIYAHQLFLTP